VSSGHAALTRTAYIARYGHGTLVPFHLASATPGTPISIGGNPQALAINRLKDGITTAGPRWSGRSRLNSTKIVELLAAKIAFQPTSATLISDRPGYCRSAHQFGAAPLQRIVSAQWVGSASALSWPVLAWVERERVPIAARPAPHGERLIPTIADLQYQLVTHGCDRIRFRLAPFHRGAARPIAEKVARCLS
jgi:hypothetical protein